MRAEQRRGIRKKISINIVVNHDLAYSERRKFRDLSLPAQAGYSLGRSFTPHAVEAVLPAQEHDKFELHRVLADAMRVDRDGVALRFRRYDDRS